MNYLRKCKRAEGSTFSIIQLIGIVIAIIVVVSFMLPFLGKLWAFLTNEPDQGTIERFNRLADVIEFVKEGEEPFSMEYYIGSRFKVVGFNRDMNEVEQTCGLFDPVIKKPMECGANACLVLCDNNKDCRVGLKDYRVFENINRIIADKDLKFNAGKSQRGDINFVLYGKCGFVNSYKVQNIKIKRAGANVVISS